MKTKMPKTIYARLDESRDGSKYLVAETTWDGITDDTGDLNTVGQYALVRVLGLRKTASCESSSHPDKKPK